MLLAVCRSAMTIELPAILALRCAGARAGVTYRSPFRNSPWQLGRYRPPEREVRDMWALLLWRGSDVP
jgi:hypothetical protein